MKISLVILSLGLLLGFVPELGSSLKACKLEVVAKLAQPETRKIAATIESLEDLVEDLSNPDAATTSVKIFMAFRDRADSRHQAYKARYERFDALLKELPTINQLFSPEVIQNPKLVFFGFQLEGPAKDLLQMIIRFKADLRTAFIIPLPPVPQPHAPEAGEPHSESEGVIIPFAKSTESSH